MSESRPAEAPGMSAQSRNWEAMFGTVLADLIFRAQDLLEWVPVCSPGSSGYMRIEALQAALKNFGNLPEHSCPMCGVTGKVKCEHWAARASVSPPQPQLTPQQFHNKSSMPVATHRMKRDGSFEECRELVYAFAEAYRVATVPLLQAPKWECHAAKFKCGYPGGGDPPDCDFPFCGCCPDAEQVISSLVEIGWQEIPVNPLERVAKAIRACEGHPINFGLGKKMSEVLKWIEAEVPTAPPSSEAPPAKHLQPHVHCAIRATILSGGP